MCEQYGRAHPGYTSRLSTDAGYGKEQQNNVVYHLLVFSLVPTVTYGPRTTALM